MAFNMRGKEVSEYSVALECMALLERLELSFGSMALAEKMDDAEDDSVGEALEAFSTTIRKAFAKYGDDETQDAFRAFKE